MARFKAGDTITNGNLILTIDRISKDSYRFQGFESLTVFYMPINIVDRLWGPYLPPTHGILEGEIVDE